MRFHCHTKVATRFRSGRLLLAGDAAHVCSPAQGHGMNSGLQDAFNLAWKLALVCRGRCIPALLDSYEAERRPVAETITASGDAAEHAHTLTDPAARRARDQALRTALTDSASRHHEAVAEAELNIDYAGSPIVMGDRHDVLAPGARLPDTIEVHLASGERRGLHELTRRVDHTALLLGGDAGGDDELTRLEGSLRDPSAPSLVEETIVLTTRTDDRRSRPRLARASAEQLGVRDVTLLVIRPDGHVGLRADREHARALGAYHSLLTSGRP
jgi:hypothetical protein